MGGVVVDEHLGHGSRRYNLTETVQLVQRGCVHDYESIGSVDGWIGGSFDAEFLHHSPREAAGTSRRHDDGIRRRIHGPRELPDTVGCADRIGIGVVMADEKNPASKELLQPFEIQPCGGQPRSI